jgi:hypothetical protein
MEGTKHTVTSADGVGIGLLTDGSGPGLLLVHGGMGSGVGVPGCSPRWRGPDVGGPAPWGAHDAGFAPQLVTVRWPGVFLADPLAVPGSRYWPAAASPDYRPVSLRFWVGRWLPASR